MRKPILMCNTVKRAGTAGIGHGFDCAMLITAVYPGTFDPITYGHSDIAQRAANMFDHVIFAVADSPHTNKRPVFTLAERVALAQTVFHPYDNIKVKSFSGLLINFAKKNKARIIIRGLRAVSDFEYEFQLAGMNRSLMPDIETVFLPTSPQYTYLSSTLAKEVARLGGNVQPFVHPCVYAALLAKMQANRQ
jgi:pantetheine-phosphate adenylyltransferase